MRIIICACLFVGLLTTAGHSDGPHHRRLSLDAFYNAQARHNHRHHRYGPYRKTDVIKPDWPYVDMPVSYPYATGTSVLDEYTGRVPVIRRGECVYPDVDWL